MRVIVHAHVFLCKILCYVLQALYERLVSKALINLFVL